MRGALHLAMRLNFKRLGLLCGKAARACARVAGLTSARADLLAILLRGEHPQVSLAAILCVSAPVITKMVRALVERALVRRRIPDDDRRYRLCSLTAEGRALAHQCLDEIGGDAADGTWSAQCIGEVTWTYDWKKPLTRLGLEVRSFIEQDEVPWPCFDAMQRWNRTNTYDGAFDGSSDHPRPLD